MRAWLQARPARQDLLEVTLAHASPRDPIWEYILDVETADANLDYFTPPLCIVGHSHVPLIFAHDADGNEEFRHIEAGQTIQLNPATRYILILVVSDNRAIATPARPMPSGIPMPTPYTWSVCPMILVRRKK